MKFFHLPLLENFCATICKVLLDNIISELEATFQSFIQRNLILLFLVIIIIVNDEVSDDEGTLQETINFYSCDIPNTYLLHQELRL